MNLISRSDLFSVYLDNWEERDSSMVECLTRGRGVVGSSLTGGTALCP